MPRAAVLTMARNEHWKDNDSLFTRMIETTPQAPLPHVNLAFTQLPRGEIHGTENVSDTEEAQLVFCYPGVPDKEAAETIFVE